MAHIVGGVSVPHTPYFPVTLPKDPEGPDARGFARAAATLASLQADVIVSFTPDHLSTFFYDKLPAFAVGVVDEFGGPNDRPPGVPYRRVPSVSRVGGQIYSHCLEHGFDLVLSAKLDVDHSLMVPLHFIEPAGALPIVPLIMNVLAPPIPTAPRALAFGRRVGAAIRALPEVLRVAFLATGSINHEVAGPRSLPGEVWAAPDPAWLDHVTMRVRDGDVDTLAREATWAKLSSVGNVAGELLTILAMAGALGDARPAYFEPQPKLGHAFGAWIIEARS